jgi:hypothetical protein
MKSHPFAPGDRVVAINTQDGPLKLLRPIDCDRFRLPDGPLRQGVVYHVSAVKTLKDGSHGVFITGLRCLWGDRDFPWCSSRFRMVEEVGHPKSRKRRRKVPLGECKYTKERAGMSELCSFLAPECLASPDGFGKLSPVKSKTK